MDITRFRGDTYPLEFSIVDQEETPIDLTGSSITFTVDPTKDPVDNSNNVFQLEGVLSATVGLVEFRPTSGQVDILGKFFYDLQLVDSSGFIKTIQTGKITFVQDITK